MLYALFYLINKFETFYICARSVLVLLIFDAVS
ncbi:hypothetical protein EMIT0P294_180068 [Pseudomonas sp. IT-P294]